MRLPQNAKAPVYFVEHLLMPLGADPSFEDLQRAVKQYCTHYPNGVPLKVVPEMAEQYGSEMRTFFLWRPPKEKKPVFFIIEESENFLLRPGQYPEQRLTDKRVWWDSQVFGVPARAAACLFMRDGKARQCPVCGVSHRDHMTLRPLKYMKGLIHEWGPDDYEKFGIQ